AEASPPSGAPDTAVIALLEEALTAVGDEDSFARSLALAMLGQALYFSDLARGESLSAEALAMARRTGDPVALSLTLLYRQVALSGPGGVAERLAPGAGGPAGARAPPLAPAPPPAPARARCALPAA